MVVRHAPLSTGFSRQGYWCGLPFPPPGDLPYPGIEPEALMSPTLAGRFFTTGATWDGQSRGNNTDLHCILKHLKMYLIDLALAARGLRCRPWPFPIVWVSCLLRSTASHCGGSSRRGARSLELEGFSSWHVGSGAWARQLWSTGSVTPHVESSWTRDRTRVPYTGRQTLNHCTTRDVFTIYF